MEGCQMIQVAAVNSFAAGQTTIASRALPTAIGLNLDAYIDFASARGLEHFFVITGYSSWCGLYQLVRCLQSTHPLER